MSGLRSFLLAIALAMVATTAIAQIPDAAKPFKRELIGNARLVWGLQAPVAVFAAQVHQESGWRPNARSAYANGLTQFTPATADWIAQQYGDVGEADPFNPSWALRALVRYDRHLWLLNPGTTACDRWAFTLAGYNGGQGWINRDRRMAQGQGADPNRWWGQVERYSRRAPWALKENRGYPRRILLTIQPRYLAWGQGVDCAGAT